MKTGWDAPKVLLAGVDRRFLNVAAAALRCMGLIVIEVHDIRVAEKELENPVAGIVLDLSLPNEESCELMEWTREAKGTAFPILACTRIPLDPTWVKAWGIQLLKKGGSFPARSFGEAVYQAFHVTPVEAPSSTSS